VDIFKDFKFFEMIISVAATFGVYILRDFKASMKDFNKSIMEMKESVSQLNTTMAVIIERDETKNIAINECRELIQINREKIHEIEKELPIIGGENGRK